MSENKSMQIIDKVDAKSALAAFLSERNEYEHKHQLNHNDRNYEVRKKFKSAGILPKYTEDKALGEFQITPSTDLDLIADESLQKINKKLTDFNKFLKKELKKADGIRSEQETIITRIRKVKYTVNSTCGCFDCQSETDEAALKVNPAKKKEDK